MVTAFLVLTNSPGDSGVEGGPFRVPAGPPDAAGWEVWNGLPGAHQIEGHKSLTGLQEMMWKYTVRCALRADQALEAPGATAGRKQKFRGSLGVAPEWEAGTCDSRCQEKVSSCLIALTNRTGKHVLLSLLSAAPAMGARLTPDRNDIAFPHQEGAFFGNVFSGEAYSCRGRDVHKGAQVKRFCALEPATCSGFAQFTDAGRCQDVCEMRCTKLPDGSERCPAVSCKDPKGRVWGYPITTYLRNKIEATNADALKGAVAGERGLEGLDDDDAATYQAVDFGAVAGGIRTFAATLAATRSRGRIEVWLEGGRRLGVLDLKSTGRIEKEATAPIDTTGLSGPNAVTLRFSGGTKIGRLSTVEFR
jgi:hypothetical protein